MGAFVSTVIIGCPDTAAAAPAGGAGGAGAGATFNRICRVIDVCLSVAA